MVQVFDFTKLFKVIIGYVTCVWDAFDLFEKVYEKKKWKKKVFFFISKKSTFLQGGGTIVPSFAQKFQKNVFFFWDFNTLQTFLYFYEDCF